MWADSSACVSTCVYPVNAVHPHVCLYARVLCVCMSSCVHVGPCTCPCVCTPMHFMCVHAMCSLVSIQVSLCAGTPVSMHVSMCAPYTCACVSTCPCIPVYRSCDMHVCYSHALVCSFA